MELSLDIYKNILIGTYNRIDNYIKKTSKTKKIYKNYKE